jgi:hypothetical protein
MIITQTRKVRTPDQAAFAWSTLRKYQNVDSVANKLMKIHSVPHKRRDNVRKQAQQLRYCMIQAREYFTAAEAVSIATKPNLLYYGTMSLALAEILFKQSGNSSLDKARTEHRHHGLSMTVGGFPKEASLETSANLIRAIPMEADGKRKGTFELWHRSSREHPLVGLSNSHFAQGGTTSGLEVIFGAIDEPYRPLSPNGITLGHLEK